MAAVRSRLIVAYLVTIAFAPVAIASAQPAPAGHETSAESVAGYRLTDPMPMDPEATVGVLPNGLKYYVRPNPKPAQRAELRLVVKAGSVLEDDDQRGLAHFVEHMMFEGTRHFPRQSLTDFLSSLGASIGPDANAATSFDDTQYIVRVPTTLPNVVDRALLVLEDWAQGAAFDQAGIDRERGIVLSEWRMNLGAAERTQEKIRRVQVAGSRYADRPPIGKPETIEGASRDALVRFYHDWYRPDLMAVMVVGDIDRDVVVSLIREHFSSLTRPSSERPRPIFDVPDRSGTRYAIVSDKETTTTEVEVTDLRPARNQGSVGGYLDIMKDALFGMMLSARLDELTQSSSPPFLRAAANRQLFPAPRTRDEAALQALVSPDSATRGVDALITELQRVVEFGFTPTELARAKQAVMNGSERVTQESPDRESASRADEYTRNFLENEALPTIWQELAFHRRFVPGITLQDVNALARDWFPEENRLVIVSAPEAAGVTLPTDSQLAAVASGAAAKRLQPYVDTVTAQTLLASPPPRGRVAKTNERADAGITEWTLSNGATVVLKPTTLREDQVLFRAFAPGGTSLASDADLPSARIADTVIPAGGVGQFNGVALNKILTGKAVAVSPFIDELDQGMSGGSTPQDLETLFQLMYLRFTAARADQVAFASLQAQARAILANQTASPDVFFSQTLDALLSQNHPRRRPDTPSSVDRWNLDTALAFYKARFADASNFTFVFVGSFTVESVRPLVETYVASLPATHAHETWRDLAIRPPSGVVEKTIEKGIAPKSEAAIVFTGPFDYDDGHRLALRTMTLVLESRLSDTLRQQLGATYSITATSSVQKFPSPLYAVRVEWTCDPAQTSALVQRVFKEIEFVRTTALSRNQVGVIHNLLLRDYDQNSQDNRYLLNQVSRRYEDGEPGSVGAIARMPDRIAELTGDAILAAAQRYLNPARYVQVTMMPETVR